MIAAMMAMLIVTLRLRARREGVEPIPRIRRPLEGRDKVMLLAAVLEHAAETNKNTHAFVTFCEKEAKEKACETDRKLSAGEEAGPLAGVPYTAKDVFCTRNIRTTGGSRILSGWLPPYNAAAVERMEKAGAILFGKTNCDEFAMGGTGENSAWQPVPCNPYDFERTTGGSSSGSAAAVASGAGAISLGTDTGGSIREPAAFCGVVGVKPTYGRVSRWGVLAFASSMDTVGPITRSVKDAALAMNALSGFDHRDNVTAKVPVPDYAEELKRGVCGMRIGISPDLLQLTIMNEKGDFDNVPIDPEITAAQCFPPVGRRERGQKRLAFWFLLCYSIAHDYRCPQCADICQKQEEKQ